MPGSEQARWYAALKHKLVRKIDARKVAEKEKLDNSAAEIYHEHVKAMCAAYARSDCSEGAGRKLAIKALWYSAGRASEPGYLTYGGLVWNRLPLVGCCEGCEHRDARGLHRQAVQLPP